MKLLVVTPSYWPAFKYGGPIQSLHFMLKQLAKNGVDITVYTTSAGIETDFKPNNSNMVDGINVFYFTYSNYLDFMGSSGWHFSLQLTNKLSKTVKDFDIVYILSIWNFPSSAAAYYCRKYNIPYVMSPRGQLYDFVLKSKSWKKKPYYELISKR